MTAAYYALIHELDDWMGKIFAKLDEHNLTEKTLVIFTSDHGEMLGAHGMREKNVFYEESAHIPLLVRLPQAIKQNIEVEGSVSTLDLFSTILDYLNMGQHPSDGKSLRGLIEGTDEAHGEYVVTEWDFRGPSEPNYMVVKDGWKLMVPYSKDSSIVNVLYDLNTDPHEMNNLIGRNPNKESHHIEKALELRSDLLTWLQQTNSKRVQGVATLTF
jgi:arylsulfatase A-like enzyme